MHVSGNVNFSHKYTHSHLLVFGVCSMLQCPVLYCTVLVSMHLAVSVLTTTSSL